MFGYVKPVKSEMLVRDFEFYRATYCGICRAMKRHTGAVSNAMLSYDSVFLALVRMLYVPDKAISAKNQRCIAHPLQKRPMLCENEALEYTARTFAILTYYKLRDDMADEKLLKKMAVSVARPIVSSARKKAKFPDICDIVADRLDKIGALERDKCASVDEPAALFGELLGELFAYGFSDSDRLVLYECGYHLGKFIYAADAAEDYDKDRQSGSYNPYVILYDGNDLTPENKNSIKCALLLECKALEGAINLLPYGNRATIENILCNIIYLGLPKRIEFLDQDTETTDKEIKA